MSWVRVPAGSLFNTMIVNQYPYTTKAFKTTVVKKLVTIPTPLVPLPVSPRQLNPSY